MQCDLGMVDKTLKKFVKKINIKFTDAGARIIRVILKPRPPGKVDDYPRQGFVERDIGMSVAAHSALGAKRFRESLTEGDTDILDGVMGVDVQIAGGLDLDIEHSVPRDLVQHVLQKRQAGIKRGVALTVKVYEHPDLRLKRIPADCGLALRHDGGSDLQM